MIDPWDELPPGVREEPPYDPTPPSDEGPYEQPTLGERRVRYKFNPGRLGTVDMLKEYAAEFITYCGRQLEDASDGEEKRLWNLAMTHAEDAAMWAVKAATFQK